METIQLQKQLPDEFVKNFGGHFVDSQGVHPCGHDGEHDPDCTTCGFKHGKSACKGCAGHNFTELPVERVVSDSTIVLKPNGSPLMIYVKDCIPRSICETAYTVLKKVDVEGAGDNRGLAAGIMGGAEDDKINRSHGSFGKLSGVGSRYHTLKKDGTMSRTTYAAAVNSAIIGYYDRYPRIPYCRQTAFLMDHWEDWVELVPYIQRVSSIFKQYAPKEYAAQKAFMDQVHPDFSIPETIFTTLTINRNWQTALHQDEGDFHSGLGVMSVLQGGSYSGSELVFPKYGCAVDMRTGGVCLADVHEWHGNTKREGTPGHYIRISAVFYAREKMIECGSAAFELERAKKVGDDIAVRHMMQSSQKRMF